VPVNDDEGLEQEADVVGPKALQMKPGMQDARPAPAFALMRRGGLPPSGRFQQETEQLLRRFDPLVASAQPVIQRVTKIKIGPRRTGVELGLLRDDEIEALIEHLKSGVNVHAVDISLDGETIQALLERAEKRLSIRQNVTPPKYNVRARAVDVERGFVFSDDSEVREMAQAQGLGAYPSQNEHGVRAIYDFKDLVKVMEQPFGNTSFWAPQQQAKGPRANAALPSGREVVTRPAAAKVKSEIALTGPCKRGDETTDRDAAMGRFSARNYAVAMGVPNANLHTWEWLHLVGASIGGGSQQGNLVAGTYDMNTLMIPLEQTIVEYASRQALSPNNPMKVTAVAKVWKDPQGGLTWVAENITLYVECGNDRFHLGPITQKTDTLTKMEFDFYHWLFQRMSGNLVERPVHWA